MTTSDRLLGLLGAAMVIGAIALLVLGGEGDTGAAATTTTAPLIELRSPAGGAVGSGPVDVVFRVPGDLARLPGGWGIGDNHLHLSIDGIEVMPSASDLERLGAGEYRWRVAALEPGPHEIFLLWSGVDHRPIPGTGSETVRITAR
jgi:hypothetical protein